MNAVTGEVKDEGGRERLWIMGAELNAKTQSRRDAEKNADE